MDVASPCIVDQGVRFRHARLQEVCRGFGIWIRDVQARRGTVAKSRTEIGGFELCSVPRTIRSQLSTHRQITIAGSVASLRCNSTCRARRIRTRRCARGSGCTWRRIEHSRDFIMECYNADGQLLGAVESTSRPCVFCGMKSSEPICRIRVLSNPYLFRTSRAIDENYAIDELCFSPPVPTISNSLKSKLKRNAVGRRCPADCRLRHSGESVELSVNGFAEAGCDSAWTKWCPSIWRRNSDAD